MKLSRESRYALTALTYLSRRPPGSVLKSRQIAAATRVPPAFLSKILNKLARGGVLNSARGGGYALARPADEITVRDALVAVEGSDLFQRCIFWRDECSEARPCPLHPTWALIRPEMTEAMGRLTLADLDPKAAAIPRARAPRRAS